VSLTPLVHVDAPLEGRCAGDAVELSDAEGHHLRTVLRLGAGAEVELADGRGGHGTGVLGPGGEVRLRTDAATRPRPRPRLELLQALPKGRKMDEVVRSCVELGLDRLVPVAATRCVTRLEGPRAAKAVERWDAVARSACQQSRRVHRPEIAGVVAVDALRPHGTWLLAHPEAGEGLPAALDAEVAAHDEPGPELVSIAIGPEGGWSDEEVDALVAAGARAVHLGAGVLRTEHAAAAALAVISARTGRWG
jgi:16S rRNA (uracil1498-N3)-methyltransferase